MYTFEFDKPEYEFTNPFEDARFTWTPIDGDKTGTLREVVLDRKSVV